MLKLSQSPLTREGIAAWPKTRVRYPTRIDKVPIEWHHMLNLNVARRKNHHCAAALLRKLRAYIVYLVYGCSGGHPSRSSMQHRYREHPKLYWPLNTCMYL